MDQRLRVLWIRIFLLLAVIAAPTVLLAFHSSERLRAGRLEMIRNEAMGIAQVVAFAQRDALNQVNSQLASLAKLDDWTDLENCQRDFYELIRIAPIYFHFALARPDGEVTCSTVDGGRGSQLGDRDYFQRAVATGNATLSPPIQSRVSKACTIVAAQPVVRDGTVRAVIAAGLSLHWAQNLVESLELPDGTIVSVSHRSGRIIARSPDPELYVGKSIHEADAFAKAVETRDSGFAYSAGLDGVPREVAFARIPDTPLYVCVGIPRSEIEAETGPTLRNGAIAMAATLLFVVGIGWGSARQLVVRPISALFDVADRIGKGDWSARTGVDYLRHVVGPLARKIDELAAFGQRTIRAYRTLSTGNRIAREIDDERTLVREMCRVAVEKGGYKFAFVGYRRRDAGKTVEQVANYGVGAEFNVVAAPTWGDDERGQGTVGATIRTGRPDVARDVANDPRFSPWQTEIAARGFASFASLPLKIDGETIGALTIVAAEAEAFDDSELSLLAELADDLSNGIASIRERRKRAEAEALAERALKYDSLTGLPNRIQFLKHVSSSIAHGRDDLRTFVMTVHIPTLQEVFDGFGYVLGNTVVRDVAARLRAIPGVEGTLARVSANEFAVVMTADDEEAAQAIAQALALAAGASVEIDGRRVDLEATVGTSIHPLHGEDGDDLLRRSAIAARDGLRTESVFSIYRGLSDRDYAERLALTADLRQAIESRELTLDFQPKVATDSGVPCGAEALVRWRHAQRGFVSPANFIPIAESSGLIRPMTYLVVEMAIDQLRAWQRIGLTLPVAINLSTKNLLDSKFIDWFERRLQMSDLPKGQVEVEITESALAEDPGRARDALLRLEALGTKLYIDDFGTGYSSLGYLATLPFHALKIDRSFVRAMADSPQARLVVSSMISMARGMSLRVVAEGVETADERARLAELGCDELQGYLFSKPLAPSAFAAKFGPAGQ